MDIAGIVGVGLPPAQTGVAKVGTVVERHGGVDDMTDGTDRAIFEVEHAIDARGERRGEAHVAVGTETTDGVDYGRIGKSVERLADGAPMPTLVVADGVGPVEVFENLLGETEWDDMLDAVLHLVERGELEEVGVLRGDVVVGREGVGERNVFVPTVGARCLFATQGVESGGTEREGGQLEVDETRLDIV